MIKLVRKCLILFHAEISKRHAVISFLGLLPTSVHDMFDGNIAVLAECHNFHLSPVEEKLDCGKNVLTDFHRRWVELSTDI